MTRVSRLALVAGIAAAVAVAGLPAWAQDGAAAPPAKPDPPKKPTAVDLALDWLARHQSPGGRFSSDAFGHRCVGETCTGPGPVSVVDVRAGALTALVFLGCGETHQTGTYKGTVKEVAKYLRNVQDVEGCFGPRVVAELWPSNHVVAATAMVELYGMTQSVVFKDSAQRGVDFALRAFDPANGFRSDLVPREPDAVALVELLGLVRSARMAELRVDPGVFDALWTWFDERLDRKTLTFPAADPKAPADALAADDRLTCAGLARVFAAKDADAVRADPLIARIAEKLAARRPVWTPAPKGRMDFAALERRVQFLFQAGGAKPDAWCRGLIEVLVASQRAGGCAKGSWDPVDVPGSAGARGRVEATALCALACEVWYRYGRVTAPPKPADAPPPGGSAAPPPK